MIVIKYSLFAAFSMLLNLLFQYLSLLVYDGFANLYLAMFMGTLAGLVAKYILDKKYIFYHKPENKTQDAKKFVSYALTGVATTLLFWGTEISFDALFANDFAKYVGAIVGLSLGYVSKYFLDKKYVFNEITT